MERIRLAGLQGDKMLAQPMLAIVADETWKAKEARLPETAMPVWGAAAHRGPAWEGATAAAFLQSGRDIGGMAMFIVGERINGMLPSVARPIRERDANAIADLARRQVAGGAHALDINTGPTGEEPAEVMTWLGQTGEEAIDIPLPLD